MDNTAHHQRQVFIGICFALLATLIWSGNFIIARGVIKTIQPVTLSFYRWLTATIIIAPFAWKYFFAEIKVLKQRFLFFPVSYTHLRAHETPEHLVCRLLLEK